jgi:hypothetical protein
MDGMDLFLELPATAQAAVICLVACASCLFVILLAAPRRDCFFFRWHPENRLFALIVSPSLLILWPILLVHLMIKYGIVPSDPDFYDD